MTTYGYARVSTGGQTLDAQTDQLRNAGASKLFSEKESGARSDRPQLAKLIKSLKTGDCILITKLDRLARSTHDLQNILKAIQNANADFKVLDTPSLDTTNPYGKLLFDILGALAEFERSLIKSRTSEGRVKAKANGIKFGRKPKLNHHQKLEAIKRRDNGETLADIAKTYNVDPTTIGRLI